VVFLSRGRALSESKNFTGSVDALNTFLSRNPNHVEGRWLRGRALASLGRREDAEKDFAQVLASPGEVSPEQFIERAQNLRQAKRNEAASAVLADGLKRLGSLITLEMAALDLEVEMHRYNEAIRRLDGLLDKADRKEAYLVRKADLFRTMGDKSNAHENYARALQAIVALPAQQRNLKSTLKLEQEARERLLAD
jgi:tetratricopeptide (TPR) repeat protein